MPDWNYTITTPTGIYYPVPPAPALAEARDYRNNPITKVPVADLNINAQWTGYTAYVGWNQPRFRAYLKTIVTDPERIDTLVDCARCQAPSVNTHTTQHGLVCNSCYHNYTITCFDCDTRTWQYGTGEDGGEVYVCTECLNRTWWFCGDCDRYYRNGTQDDHDHPVNANNCNCDPVGLDFQVPLKARRLGPDQRFGMALPEGAISPEGMQEIAKAMNDYAFGLMASGNDTLQARRIQAISNPDYLVTHLGTDWSAARGTYPKRVASLLYKHWNEKLPPDLATQIGNIGRDHSKGGNIRLEVTRNLNLPREEFAHDGSCWWTEYNASRCAFKTNGGFALRSFKRREVTGRAWVWPMRATELRTYGGKAVLTPTFETLKPDALLVFNGYGSLSDHLPARLVAAMYGMAYRKIALDVDPLYINNERGYLIADADRHELDIEDLSLEVRTHANLFDTEKREVA